VDTSACLTIVAATEERSMSWMNVARGLKVLALVLFLTPWLVVSCQGTPLIEASGMDLISGDLEPPADSPLGGLAAQAEAESQRDLTVPPEGGGEASDPERPGAGVLEAGRWWALAGALLIVVALGAGLLLKPARRAATVALAASMLALAALGGGMAWTVSEFKAELREALNEAPAEAPDDEFSQFGRTMAAGVAGAIQIEVKFGYWLALIALGLGAGATFMAMNGAVLPQITTGPRDG
jgi:hypothetical protein